MFFKRLSAIIMLLFLAHLTWAEDVCNSSECNYSVSLDRSGFYAAVVTLANKQTEGLWNLAINPSKSSPKYSKGFWAGSVVKEQGKLPNWVGFSLAETESVSITPYDWTGDGLPLDVRIDKFMSNRKTTVYGPALMKPDQIYTTRILGPGIYVASLSNQSDSPRNFKGLVIEGNSLYGGVVGGYLDSSTGMGYGGFIINSPQQVDFQLQFGDSFESGASQPKLEIFYQNDDGSWKSYWSAPKGEPLSTFPALVHTQKGSAVLLSSDAKQTWNMPTQFFGGISVEDSNFLALNTATHFQKISVKAEIKVQAEHVGQNADLLLIIGTEPQQVSYDEGADTTYTTVSGSNSFHPLDWYIPANEQQPVEMYVPAEGWQPELITAYNSAITLQKTMQVEFQHDKFTVPGMYYFYIAYRLENGDIIYNPMPIKLDVQAGEQPYFPGIVQIVGTNVDSISLAWLPASDNKTPPDAITYEIHLSDQPDFEPTANTLHTSVTGKVQTDLVGLATATSSNLLVVAVDADGNRSKERDYRIARTFAKSPVVSSTAKFAEDKQLGLGEATTQDGKVFIYSSATPGVQPEIGSILFANVGKDVYLRKVDSVENTAQGLIVHTSDGELAEILETATIDSQVTLFDVSKVAPRIGSRSGVRTSRSLNASGSENYIMRWPNDTLVVEQDNYANNERSTRANGDTNTDKTETDKTEKDKTEKDKTEKDKKKEYCEANPQLKFEPKMDVKVAWEKGGLLEAPKLTSGHAIAGGTLSAELGLTCVFGAKNSVEKSFVVFVKRITQTYLIGGIPIVQDTILSVKAKLSAKATAGIRVKLTPKASASIKIGAKFDPVTDKWVAIPMSPAFKMSLTEQTVDDVVDNGVLLEGEIRLIPEIQVRFFKLIGPKFSLEPFAKTEIKYEPTPKPTVLASLGYLPIHPTQFDVYLQAEAFVGVSTVFFSKKMRDLLKTQIWESPKWTLFSLPKLNFNGGSGEVNEPITLTATTEDGKHNPFDDSSIRWNVDPKDGSASGGKTGTFRASKEGNYTVFFSGTSQLPSPFGRQFVVANVNVGPDEEEEEKPDGPEASTNGDPHLYTFDDLAYDFQAVGEFILAKSTIPNDSFEVQVRQKAWGQRNDVAITQAAAMNVVGDKVGFYLKQKPVTSINGIPQELPQGTTFLPQGGSIIRRGSLYSVAWPNKSGLVKIKNNNYGFLVSNYISKAQEGKIVGLLGNADGNPKNDIVMRNGTKLEIENLSFETLYPNYANSWRVTQEESLFDYAEGESTEFFTDYNFPRILSKSTAIDPATRAAAEQTCRDAGITDPVLLEDCILDVALTGEKGFAQIPADLASPIATANVIAPPPPTLGTSGFGQLKGTIYDAVTKQIVNNARVKFYLDGVNAGETTTVNGIYESNVIPNGNYYLTIEADGYIAEKAFKISVNEVKLQEVDAIYLVPITHNRIGKITGIVKNALGNTALKNIYVSAYRYINQGYSPDAEPSEFGYTTTDSTGKFTLENLNAGNYTLQFYGQLEEGDYIFHKMIVLNIGGQTTTADVSITPSFKGFLRIVTSWNNTPYDLDAHLTGPNNSKDSRFHIYFANQEPNEASARLNRDDRDGSGPEIITIDHLNYGDAYRFSVHDYTNGGSTSSNLLAKSGAKVDVYSRKDGLVSFEVPNQEGTLWTVFEIDEFGIVKPINTMGYEVKQGGVRTKSGIRSRNANSILQKPVATDYWPIVFQNNKP